jgi:YgiT-type zinc finger domain-containing protein
MMTKKSPFMVCDMCGKPNARLRHLTHSYGKGDDLLVIENVPVVSCTACGESYLTAETIRTIDELKRQRATRAVKKPVAVADFVDDTAPH